MRITTLGKQLVAIAVASFAMLSVQDASPQASQRINPDLERFASQCKVGDGDGCAKLADLARHDKDWQVRQAAIARLTDQVVLTEIATRAAINTDRKLAAGRLTDGSVLANIVKTDDPIVRRAAAWRLGETLDLRCPGAPTDEGRAAPGFKKVFIRTPYVVLEGVSDSALRTRMSTALVEIARQILAPAGIAVAADGQAGSAATLDLLAIGEADAWGYAPSGIAIGPSGVGGVSTRYSGASWKLVSALESGDRCIWGEAVHGRIGPPSVIGWNEYTHITDAPFRDALVVALSDGLLKLLAELRATTAIATLARTSKIWQVRTAASGNQRFASPTASLRADPRRTSYTTARDANGSS